MIWTQPKQIGSVRNDWYWTKMISTVQKHFGSIERQGMNDLTYVAWDSWRPTVPKRGLEPGKFESWQKDCVWGPSFRRKERLERPRVLWVSFPVPVPPPPCEPPPLTTPPPLMLLAVLISQTTNRNWLKLRLLLLAAFFSRPSVRPKPGFSIKNQN